MFRPPEANDETLASPEPRQIPPVVVPGSVVLGRYRILALLGAGGMGAVYQAEDLRLGRLVALKFLHGAGNHNSEALARFDREARIVSALSHPNIRTLFDIAEQNGMTFLVLEYLEGETLQARLQRGSLSLTEIIESAIQVADALDSVHQQGIIHRDIKPANLFLTLRGQTKILDFGIAKLAPVCCSDTALTLSGDFIGTAAYMAPEQARGAEVDTRADLFSLGAVLYEMASGQPAFLAETLALTFDALLNRDPFPLSSDLPAQFSAIITAALAKDRELRYADALTLLTDLRNLKQQTIAVTRVPERITLTPFGDSIAVLPFENRSKDLNLEYLGEGIAERILNSLSQIASLRVIPRATAFRYLASDASRIARELNVRVVLTGRVAERANRLVIGTELIDGHRGALLWGEKYERRLDDLMALESEIAHEIATKLRIHLSPQESERLLQWPTHNAEAYKTFMGAMYYANKWTRNGLQKGLTLLRQAIDMEPAFAAAYAGLGYVYILLSFFGIIAPRDGYPKAKSAALRILELEAHRASAHLLLGFTALCFDWDWQEAEKHILLALQLSPLYPNGHWARGYWFCAMGRFEEAADSMRHAVMLDPLSAPIRSGLATAYYWGRRFDLAAQTYREAIEVEPTFFAAYHTLAVIYAEQGQFDEAFRCLDQGDNDPSQLERACIARAMIHAMRGDSEAAHRCIQHLDRQHQSWAAIYAVLGEEDNALAILEESFQERASYLILVANNPSFAGMYQNPRFIDLVRRIGLPASA